MGLKCLFGHKWNGCKCEYCGKLRDEQHNWNLCKGICIRCGKTRDEQHQWNGCKCTICGKIRNEGHNHITISECVKKCSTCGKESWNHSFIPNKDNIKTHICTVCGQQVYHSYSLNMCVAKCECGHEKPAPIKHNWAGTKCTYCDLKIKSYLSSNSTEVENCKLVTNDLRSIFAKVMLGATLNINEEVHVKNLIQDLYYLHGTSAYHKVENNLWAAPWPSSPRDTVMKKLQEIYYDVNVT